MEYLCYDSDMRTRSRIRSELKYQGHLKSQQVLTSWQSFVFITNLHERSSLQGFLLLLSISIIILFQPSTPVFECSQVKISLIRMEAQ